MRLNSFTAPSNKACQQYDGMNWVAVDDLPNFHRESPAVVSFRDGESVWFITGMDKVEFMVKGKYTEYVHAYISLGADSGQ
jgi:hypothetical protein